MLTEYLSSALANTEPTRRESEPPAFRTSAAAPARPAAPRATMATSKPRPASSRTTALPTPAVPPVTTATFADPSATISHPFCANLRSALLAELLSGHHE